MHTQTRFFQLAVLGLIWRIYRCSVLQVGVPFRVRSSYCDRSYTMHAVACSAPSKHLATASVVLCYMRPIIVSPGGGIWMHWTHTNYLPFTIRFYIYFIFILHTLDLASTEDSTKLISLSTENKHLKKSNAACFYTPVVLKLLIIVQMWKQHEEGN